MSRRLAVEIAVQDRAGVRVALEAGADRIELCSALGVGGLTPSAGLIEAAVAEAQSAGRDGFVHVLIRPRAGGFVYDADEVELALADIRFARRACASGVVVGALDAVGAVDTDAVARFVAEAGDLDVTFHRAIDIAPDPLGALDTLAALGVRRILTSGGASRSIDGVGMLAALAAESAGRVQVMAGGGVGVTDIAGIAATGVDAVHLSARTTVTGSPSGPGGGAASYDVTDAAVVREALAAAY
ncbi:copper homeostasis protein CutC [Leifsonia sp. PS1209]|uniref:copper homeostasis protein CutC n=1 Tax=Leifsonia sp. PS1209 TaxID=2724914 RepID=UPI001442CC9E|nr:copper homeostasis protein CutC [Leifsonia sp. PS1209]QIZ98463.1 copper homeostasis protein CutC [Leifsonia sp. PS1209]